jgi:hypothetical protein
VQLSGLSYVADKALYAQCFLLLRETDAARFEKPKLGLHGDTRKPSTTKPDAQPLVDTLLLGKASNTLSDRSGTDD